MKIFFLKVVSFWIWRNLSGGETPFYQSPELEKFQAPIAPSADAWWGWKLQAWTAAQDYLVSCGELTYTPTLKEKF